jgi:hypothetical protein
MTLVWVESYRELNATELQTSEVSKLHITKLLVAVIASIYVVLCVIVAFVPWRSWKTRQFSLKALFIAATLFAIGLGLAVYVARK